MTERGYDITGYDPYVEKYANIAPLNASYDAAMCIYVLNTIPDVDTRLSVVSTCLSLAPRLLLSVRNDARAIKRNCVPYGDGYITGTNTFQKVYTAESLAHELAMLPVTFEILLDDLTTINAVVMPDRSL